MKQRRTACSSDLPVRLTHQGGTFAMFGGPGGPGGPPADKKGAPDKKKEQKKKRFGEAFALEPPVTRPHALCAARCAAKAGKPR